MKRYYRAAAVLALLLLTGGIVLAAYTRNMSPVRRDDVTVTLNEISMAAAKGADLSDLPADAGHGRAYVILDNTGNIVCDTRTTHEPVSVQTAIKMNYPYTYVIRDSRVAGCVILIDDHNSFGEVRARIITGYIAGSLLLISAMLIFGRYIRKEIIDPFRNMQEFAGNIAEGRLDSPLMMAKNNMFGKFSESFDIMRDELVSSRERELALQKKERELVASLSHDLKTPVTGIKLTAELLRARYEMDGDSAMSADTAVKLDNIYKKADEIDVLVSDLFASALEELGEFKIECTDAPSSVIADIVRKYDDKGLTVSGEIPEVLINTDVKRLSQVIGNIISNSYKYADTKIDITYTINGSFLEMHIHDHGPGVPQDELSLITNKFYRGKGSAGKEGSGLGLYIARSLMDNMNGDMMLRSDGDGLCITLFIPLS